uniref:Uncharacterized protein n=1 Tax=Pararge aegeria TaxID=116150 RepID=S4P7S1_9NEOP
MGQSLWIACVKSSSLGFQVKASCNRQLSCRFTFSLLMQLKTCIMDLFIKYYASFKLEVYALKPSPMN